MPGYEAPESAGTVAAAAEGRARAQRDIEASEPEAPYHYQYSSNRTWSKKESFFAYCARTCRELWRFRFALANMVVSGLSRRYRRSVLGFLWSLLNPLLSMIVLTVVFSAVFKQEISKFAPHIFSALLPWTMMTTTIILSSLSLIDAEGLIKKIYVPKILFPLVAASTELINFGLSLLCLFGLGMVLGFSPTPAIVALPVVIALTFVFTLGIGITLAVANVYFRDLTHIVQVLLSAMFYTVPILYPIETLPPELRNFVDWNPFYHFLKLFQEVIRDGVMPSAAELALPAMLAAGALAIGLASMKAVEKKLVFRL